MTIKIKHVSELPDWFDLKKYDFCEEIKAVGWYEQIYARWVLAVEWDEFRLDPNFFNGHDYAKYKSATEAVQENPNIDILADNRLSDHMDIGGALRLLKPKIPDAMLGIRSITLRDYAHLSRSLDQNKYEFALDWLNSANIRRSELPHWMDTPLYRNNTTKDEGRFDTLSIDLTLPDKYLMDNFKQFLKHARDRGVKPSSKYYSSSQFKNWSQLKVLAYSDLILWARIENTIIPTRVMADALYPDGEKGEETVRKTLKPLAKEIIHCDTFNQLSNQAALDIDEELHQEALDCWIGTDTTD